MSRQLVRASKSIAIVIQELQVQYTEESGTSFRSPSAEKCDRSFRPECRERARSQSRHVSATGRTIRSRLRRQPCAPAHRAANSRGEESSDSCGCLRFRSVIRRHLIDTTDHVQRPLRMLVEFVVQNPFTVGKTSGNGTDRPVMPVNCSVLKKG